MNAVVADPYGLNHLKRDKDYSDSLKLEYKLFPKFIQLLNKYHNTNYSQRFWQIVLGHWFKFCIRDLFYYVSSIMTCMSSYNISGMTAYDSEDGLYFYDTLEMTTSLSFDNVKLNLLHSRIINLIKNKNFLIEVIPLKKNTTHQIFKPDLKIDKKFFWKNFIKYGFKFYEKISNYLIRNDDAFIVNSFLTTKNEAKLELSLGQLPQFWKYKCNKYDHISSIKKTPNKLLRQNLTNQFLDKSSDNLERIVRHLIFELLPICYLEGFKDLNNIVKAQCWPKSPKFIFTSNNFYYDEVFKLYTALNVEKGKKYYVGQHGGNYGTQKWKSPRIEELTADKFITWGWTDDDKKYKPAFVLKNSGKKRLSYKSSGNLLLIEHGYTKHDATYDKKYTYLQYLEKQKEFVNYLDKKPREKLVLRLFNKKYRNDEWCEELRWTDFDPKIELDDGINKIESLISKSRLVVYSYDSTGMLETLSDNIPTLAFWGKEVGILESARPYYQLLVDAGIIHYSSKSIAEKINEVWDNIDNWWYEKNIQEARRLFCDRFARKTQNPVKELKQILLS